MTLLLLHCWLREKDGERFTVLDHKFLSRAVIGIETL